MVLVSLKVPNEFRVAGDWFGALDADGVPDDEQSLQFELHDTTPVDCVGMVFRMMAYEFGAPWSLEYVVGVAIGRCRLRSP